LGLTEPLNDVQYNVTDGSTVGLTTTANKLNGQYKRSNARLRDRLVGLYLCMAYSFLRQVL